MTTCRTFVPKSARLGVMTAALGLLALSACAPSVPDSGAGVGFQNYNSYIRNAGQPQTAAPAYGDSMAANAPMGLPAQGFDIGQASAALDRAEGIAPQVGYGEAGYGQTAGAFGQPLEPISALSVAPGPDPSAALVAAPVAPPAAGAITPFPQGSAAATSGTRPRGNAPATIREQNGEMVHISGGISDENDFDAVANRETIQSDAERIAANRAQYVVVQPKDLPVRPGDTGPNIVEYALATTNQPGQPLYTRGRSRQDLLVLCAKYSSPDQAQQEFLSKGGPQKDRAGLDPDGDGFACDWDPRPFRAALQ